MVATDTKRLVMIEEIEFLLSCGVGEAAILQATGYTHNPDALQRRLTRAKRHDLIPRIFEWQNEYEQRHHPKEGVKRGLVQSR